MRSLKPGTKEKLWFIAGLIAIGILWPVMIELIIFLALVLYLSIFLYRNRRKLKIQSILEYTHKKSGKKFVQIF